MAKASTKALLDIVNVWNKSDSAENAAEELGYTVKTLEGKIQGLRSSGIVNPGDGKVYHFPIKSFKTGTGGGGSRKQAFDPDAIMQSIADARGVSLEVIKEEATQLAADKVTRLAKAEAVKAAKMASTPEENVETTAE